MPTVRLRGEKESEAISKEINIVIHFEVYENVGVELQLDDSEKLDLEHALSTMPHRTYLWLHLIIGEFRRQPSFKKTMQQILSHLPPTVEAAYEAILERSSDPKLARKLLCIVVAAVRPLTLQEIDIALAIEDEQRSYIDLAPKLEKETQCEVTIRHLCGLFITVVDHKVYLIHQTAKEFLLAKKELGSGIWRHSIEPAVAELIIAKTCITYLLFDEFCTDWGLESYFPKMKAKAYTDEYHYLDYAASQWGSHFGKAQVKVDEGTLQSVLKICDN